MPAWNSASASGSIPAIALYGLRGIATMVEQVGENATGGESRYGSADAPADPPRAGSRSRAGGRRPLASSRPRRGDDAARQAALEGRSGRDRPAGRAPAAGHGARLCDQRQDDDDRDGGRDPAAARATRNK